MIMMLLLPLLVSEMGVDEALVAAGVQQYEMEIKSAEHLGLFAVSQQSKNKSTHQALLVWHRGRGENDSFTRSIGIQ
jgi:hypothetical protein